jgi:hypothetical protein
MSLPAGQEVTNRYKEVWYIPVTAFTSSNSIPEQTGLQPEESVKNKTHEELFRIEN